MLTQLIAKSEEELMMIESMFSIWFVAGVFGGLLNAVFVWVTGRFGINRAIGLAVKPDWTTGFLYNKLVWGGIWGVLFYFVGKSYPITLYPAFLVSLAPTAVQLFYIFPLMAKKGFAGKDLGRFTWAYVIVSNLVWAVGAYGWFKSSI